MNGGEQGEVKDPAEEAKPPVTDPGQVEEAEEVLEDDDDDGEEGDDADDGEGNDPAGEESDTQPAA